MDDPEKESQPEPTGSNGATAASDSFWYGDNHNKTFATLLLVTLLMTIWPWIFFWVVFGKDGIEMHGRAAKVANNHPQDVSFFVTAISSVISIIVAYLFSKGVASVAQKWIVYKEMDIANVSFLTALKNRAVPISLFVQGRYRPFLIVVFYVVIFIFVTPGLVALLLPHPFTRYTSLAGTELDFASTKSDCISWFNNNTIPNTCDWITYKGFSYTYCLAENQMVDVLESGRGSMLSLISNNTVSLTFAQLGAVGGLHFLGTTGGVLPVGPNGIPAFDTLLPSPLSDEAVKSYISYNYSLDLQGISSKVSCAYQPTTPITYQVVGNIFHYNGSCPTDQGNILAKANFVAVPSNNSLGFWACQTSQTGDAYDVYFSGRINYAQGIGDIACTVAPAQPALYRLNYAGLSGVFSTAEPISTSPNTSTELITRSIMGLGDVVCVAKNPESNLVAESVITFGVKDFGLPPYNQSNTYLRLYEAMVQGILDYQATYIRLIYSTKVSTAPSSCLRTVTGTGSYVVFGWEAKAKTAAYLLLMTLVNLTSIALFVIAMSIRDQGKRLLPRFDPTDPESVILSSDPSGTLLHTSTTDPKNRMPGDAKVAFGKHTAKEGVRLWVPAEREAVIPP